MLQVYRQNQWQMQSNDNTPHNPFKSGKLKMATKKNKNKIKNWNKKTHIQCNAYRYYTIQYHIAIISCLVYSSLNIELSKISMKVVRWQKLHIPLRKKIPKHHHHSWWSWFNLIFELVFLFQHQQIKLFLLFFLFVKMSDLQKYYQIIKKIVD
jgi:hypothetical protein